MIAEDTQLLEGIKNQKQTSLEEFYQRYENTVYRFALSKLNNTFDAADVVNEVMLEVWKSAHRFEGRSKVSSWLLGITHHKVIDLLRKRKNNLVDIEEANLITDETQSVDHIIENNECDKFMQECLKTLKGDHKQAIHLLFYKDYTYEEISEVIECPIGTVKSRIHHAKIAIKNCLHTHIHARS